MKFLNIILIVFAIITSSFVIPTERNSDGIQFENLSFKEALEKAKKENKLVFMDAYTVWCGPCRMLSNTTFKSEKVGEAFNKHFVNIKVDMEKGEGIDLAKKYKVNAYPTLFIFQPDGKVEKRIIGFRDANQLLSEVKDYVK